MTDTIGWDDIPDNTPRKSDQSSSKTEESLFMRFTSGDNTIRLVGKPIVRDIAWLPNPEVEGKNLKFVVPKEYKGRIETMGFDVRPNYIVCVFDRADTEAGITRLKILEKGVSVFQPFKTYFAKRKDKDGNPIDPGGKLGPDWSIEAKGTGRNTKYNIQPLDASPWTSDEAKLLKAKPEDNQDKPRGERGFFNENKGNYLLDLLYNTDKAAEKLEKYLKENSGLSNTSTENVDDYEDPASSIDEVGSLDDLPSIDENDESTTATAVTVESQLDEVF